MKKWIAIAILLTAGQAWGANETYYVSPSGSNSSPYNTWDNAATALGTVLNTVNSDLDNTDADIVYIAPGTYSENLSIPTANASNATFTGTAAHGSTAPAVADQVIITAASSGASFRLGGAHNFTLNNITVTGGFAYAIRVNNTDNATFNNVTVRDSGASLNCLQVDGTSANFILNKSNVQGCAVSAVVFANTSTGTVKYSIISPSSLAPTTTTGHGIYVTSSGTVNLYNNVIAGYKGGNGIDLAGGTVNISNNYVGSPVTKTKYAIVRESGTVNATNNMAMRNWDNTSAAMQGTFNTNTGNIITSIPKYRTPKRGGILSINIDDSDAVGTDWLLALETSLANHGMKATHFVSGYSASDNAVALKAMSDRGVIEIGSHGWSHSYLDNAATALTVVKAGATITVDRDADTITISGAGTVTGFKAKSLSDIGAELEALGVTVTNLGTGVVSLLTQGESLTGVAGQAITDAYNMPLLIDNTAATGFYKSEMVNSKDALETAIGRSVVSIATPNNAASANTKAAAIAAGYESLRYSDVSNASVNWLLPSYDLYLGAGANGGNFVSATPEEVRQAAYRYGQMIVESGSFMNVFFHYNGGAPVMSNAMFDTMLDALAEIPGLVVTSYGDAISRIKAAGSTADNVTYTRTWTGAADYSLLSNSPLINAGTDVGLTTDILGNPMRGSAWDIGAYEYQGGLNRIPNFPNFPSFPSMQ